MLKEAAVGWSSHKDARLGAALAYYSVFSIAPLLLIAIAVAGLAFDPDAVRQAVGTQLRGLLGTAALAAGAKYIEPWLPEAAMHVTGMAISFGFVTLLFATMFKWLPDARIGWRDVWPGALFTAALFEIGKFLIGLYIGKQGLESTFGAAASFVWFARPRTGTAGVGIYAALTWRCVAEGRPSRSMVAARRAS